VEIRYDDRQLRLRVRDDGKGIDPKALEVRKRSGHWGLHGMHERARLVGGILNVWSEVKSGTEVELIVPAAKATRLFPLDATPGGLKSSHGRDGEQGVSSDPSLIRVLAVDDHPVLRQGIAGLIASQLDMRLVGEASNGREAIQQFRALRPDVTLMDLQMPEMNGIDAISAIRGEFPEARIIVLTTYAGDVQALRAMKAGARGYLLRICCIRNSWTRSVRCMRGKRPCPLRFPINLPSTQPMKRYPPQKSRYCG